MPLQAASHASALAAISQWDEYAATPLVSPASLAAALGIGELHLKDETARLGVNSFKALGGAYAIERVLARDGGERSPAMTTASAGNHGIGLAWGCRRVGLPCHVFLGEGVGEAQAARIRSYGATVHRVEGNYEASLAACQAAADDDGWQVVQDVSWEGYEAIPADIYAGYTVIAHELAAQLPAGRPPTHVLVNAGVGGLACAVCASLWQRYGAARPRLICVEPTAADCLGVSAAAGALRALPAARVAAEATVQVGLDCKVPAPLAWAILDKGATDFVAVPDAAVAPCVELLAALAPPLLAGESAVAGLGAVVAAAHQPALRAALGLDGTSRVVAIVCEGPAA